MGFEQREQEPESKPKVPREKSAKETSAKETSVNVVERRRIAVIRKPIGLSLGTLSPV